MESSSPALVLAASREPGKHGTDMHLNPCGLSFCNQLLGFVPNVFPTLDVHHILPEKTIAIEYFLSLYSHVFLYWKLVDTSIIGDMAHITYCLNRNLT